jgi:hypothetical protein
VFAQIRRTTRRFLRDTVEMQRTVDRAQPRRAFHVAEHAVRVELRVVGQFVDPRDDAERHGVSVELHSPMRERFTREHTVEYHH